jgi:hypothetical protein
VYRDDGRGRRRQLPTQLYIAYGYTSATLVLFIQHLVYNYLLGMPEELDEINDCLLAQEHDSADVEGAPRETTTPAAHAPATARGATAAMMAAAPANARSFPGTRYLPTYGTPPSVSPYSRSAFSPRLAFPTHPLCPLGAYTFRQRRVGHEAVRCCARSRVCWVERQRRVALLHAQRRPHHAAHWSVRGWLGLGRTLRAALSADVAAARAGRPGRLARLFRRACCKYHRPLGICRRR